MSRLDDLREAVKKKRKQQLEDLEIKNLEQELEKDTPRGKAKKILRDIFKKIWMLYFGWVGFYWYLWDLSWFIGILDKMIRKTSIWLDDEIYQEAKIFCVKNSITMYRFINESIKENLKKYEKSWYGIG